MNATTAPNFVSNTTPLSVIQQQQQHQGEVGEEYHGGNHTVEAYTVVLSLAAHITSMFFGGGSTLAVLTAVTTRGNINKCSYLLVLTLFLACCCLNFVWSPLEMGDLLLYHFHHRHPSQHYVEAKTAIYVFLVILVHIVILLLSVEGIIRVANCFGRVLQRVWPFSASLFAVGWSAILTAILISKMASDSDSTDHSYVITDQDTRETLLTIIVFIFSLSCLALLLLIIQCLKIHLYCKDGWPHLRRKKMNLALPEFLISQSQNPCVEEEETGGYDNVNEPSTSRSPSPSTPKLLTVSSPETESMKGGGDASPAPSPTPKSSGNRLGINMSQVLGRRRHTICQISDSANTPPSDPIAKAKQYNYVRKFSVDISALQAQLQNPKIFKEAPFQSDIDLTKKAEEAKSRAAKPLQPLQPLNFKIGEKKESPKVSSELKVDTPQSAGLSVPPPVIMVSNDDALSENEEGVNDKSKSDQKTADSSIVVFDFEKDNCNHHGNKPEKPTSLPLKESSRIDDVTSVPTLESAITDPSDTELESSKLARLAIYMGVTFVLSLIPVLVTEALRSTMSLHAFLNISTCTLAISVIQTIVYPHLIASSDDVVHRGVRRLNDRMKTVFCRGEIGTQAHVDDASSTSQV